MKKTLIASTILLGLANAGTNASPSHPEGDSRKAAKKEFRAAIASGELTPDEAKQLRKLYRGIRRAHRNANQDGSVSKEEQAGLEKMKSYAKQIFTTATNNDIKVEKSK